MPQSVSASMHGPLALGVDMGTSTLCATVVRACDGAHVHTRTVANDTFLPASGPGFREQDAARLLDKAVALVRTLCDAYPIDAIGITGQMHGCVYLDANGRVCSPLATWEDGRGNQPYRDGQTFAAYLARALNMPMASGYGVVTHFWNAAHHAVPENARRIATIMDALALRLTGGDTPLLHASNAASLGGFALETGAFCTEALAAAGIDPSILPSVAPDDALPGAYVASNGREMPVALPIGDNQASFLGAVAEPMDSILVNIGTGSQVSLAASAAHSAASADIRPFVRGDFLYVGAALCGGRAYAGLERLFRAAAEAAGGTGDSLYAWLNREAERALEQDVPPLRVDTRFDGTRAHPEQCGSITGIRMANWTPGQLACGFLYGIADELRALYVALAAASGGQRRTLIASGNAVRCNPALRRILARVFEMDTRMPAQAEECARGAAFWALHAAGLQSLETSARTIRYAPAE